MKTAHELEFEAGDWHIEFRTKLPMHTPNVGYVNSQGFKRFRVGTCHGIWRVTPFSYDILAIVNEEPGNGHLEDVFQWFEASCRRDNLILRVLEIWNERFAKHLEKKGFTRIGKDAVKMFT